MASLVRLTVQLQQLVLRLSGLLLATALSIYLICWAADPPPNWLNAFFALVLAATVLGHGALHARKRAHESTNQVDLGFFSSLCVAVYAIILHLPGGLGGPFYPLVYVAMMASAAYSRPSSAVATVAFAGALEVGLRTIALGELSVAELAPRLGFLVVFTALNVVLFRVEIARVRRISRDHVAGEMARLKEAARSYRLSGGTEVRTEVLGSEDRALQSAVGEVQQAVLYAMRLLRKSLGLQTAALLVADGRGKMSIFEAESDHALEKDPLRAEEGIFAVALDRGEPITVCGKRAAHHALVYPEPQVVGSLVALPIVDGPPDAPRSENAILWVDRQEQVAFSESELSLLKSSGAFLMRALQNERVFSSLERANREQGKLYRAAEALSSARTEADVIEVGVESARQVAAFDFAAVTLFHRKGGSHEICAVSGEGSDALVGRTFRHNAGLVSMVVANRHALPYRGEYEPTRQTVFSRGHEPPKMPSLLVLPLMVHERVLGTLVLGSKEKHAFSQNVRPALEVLASHMSVSLSNARMLKRLEEQATTDGMTGLLNKRTLIVEAEKRIKVAARFSKPLSLLVTDIDHFKKVNDNYGHDVGDVVIKGLGDVLRRIKRDTDLVGRFGGEEFVIVCEQTDEAGARNLAERIRRELEATTFQTELGPLSVTCSVGVAPFPSAGRDWESLFKATDEALYVSKRQGRNQVTVWKPGLKTSAA